MMPKDSLLTSLIGGPYDGAQVEIFHASLRRIVMPRLRNGQWEAVNYYKRADGRFYHEDAKESIR